MYVGGIPIVSLDKIYLIEDNRNIIFLDCTRLDGTSNLVSRNNVNDLENVDKQIKVISELLKENNTTNIILADDVVFSGSVLKTITEKFKSNNINVIGIRSCISTLEGFLYFNKTLPLGLKCGYLLDNDVIDQICERDFYFGIAQSGISQIKNNEVVKAPYFLPFGNPNERASIPKEYEIYFSQGCLERSLCLWNEIEKLSKKNIFMKDLPEKINGTNGDELVIKVLKKGMK